MLKMPVKEVLWILLKKVSQAPKYLEYPSTQVLKYVNALSASCDLSGLSVQVS